MFNFNFLLTLFLISFSFEYNTYDASNLKLSSYYPDPNYDPSKKISNFNIDMINYYSWFGSYGYCTDEEISSGNCCKNKNLLNSNWKMISHNKVKKHFFI